MTALAALADAIAKAGLIKPGKRPLLHRVGFLLSTGKNDRKAAIGRYLESRKRGKGFGPRGRRRARTGTYTGVYATGVNKSESGMDALQTLDAAIEKAVKFRGQMMSPAQRRNVALGRSARHVWRERGLTQVRVGGEGGKRRGVRGYQAKTTPSRKQREIAARLNIRKSEDAMTDAVDDLYEAIEKAQKNFRGTKVSSKQRRNIATGKLDSYARSNDGKAVMVFGRSRSLGGKLTASRPKFVPRRSK